jgi:hypothetical protein
VHTFHLDPGRHDPLGSRRPSGLSTVITELLARCLTNKQIQTRPCAYEFAPGVLVKAVGKGSENAMVWSRVESAWVTDTSAASSQNPRRLLDLMEDPGSLPMPLEELTI